MTKLEVNELLQSAISALITEQRILLDVDVTERNLSHHLANYIAQRLPKDSGLHVDVEYNRDLLVPKRLSLLPRKAVDRELRATTVFPDIVVHRRNSVDDNLLVLEMKKPGEGLDYDEIKLKEFLKVFHYKYAAHVILGLKDGALISDVFWVENPTT